MTRVVTDMSNDPDLTALALAKTKLTMASFSRQQEFEADGIGVGLAARAHFDPYGAARFLSSMERNAALKVGKTPLDPRAQDHQVGEYLFDLRVRTITWFNKNHVVATSVEHRFKHAEYFGIAVHDDNLLNWRGAE